MQKTKNKQILNNEQENPNVINAVDQTAWGRKGYLKKKKKKKGNKEV